MLASVRHRGISNPKGDRHDFQAYLSFDGRCEEAIEVYKRALGAVVQMLTRFKDGPASVKRWSCALTAAIGERRISRASACPSRPANSRSASASFARLG